MAPLTLCHVLSSISRHISKLHQSVWAAQGVSGRVEGSRQAVTQLFRRLYGGAPMARQLSREARPVRSMATDTGFRNRLARTRVELAPVCLRVQLTDVNGICSRGVSHGEKRSRRLE